MICTLDRGGLLQVFACPSELKGMWLSNYSRPAMNQRIDLEVTPSLHATFAMHLNLVHVSFVLNGKTLPEHFSFSFLDAERLGQRIEETGMWVHFPVIGVSPGALKTFGRRLRDFAIHQLHYSGDQLGSSARPNSTSR